MRSINCPHGQGVLTETTAELAASLSVAAARRIVEADGFMRAGLYDGWLPHLYDHTIKYYRFHYFTFISIYG
jgi:lactate dehydrogenase-like 2-hydroxyacid dehydrogenase